VPVSLSLSPHRPHSDLTQVRAGAFSFFAFLLVSLGPAPSPPVETPRIVDRSLLPSFLVHAMPLTLHVCVDCARGARQHCARTKCSRCCRYTGGCIHHPVGLPYSPPAQPQPGVANQAPALAPAALPGPAALAVPVALPPAPQALAAVPGLAAPLPPVVAPAAVPAQAAGPQQPPGIAPGPALLSPSDILLIAQQVIALQQQLQGGAQAPLAAPPAAPLQAPVPPAALPPAAAAPPAPAALPVVPAPVAVPAPPPVGLPAYAGPPPPLPPALPPSAPPSHLAAFLPVAQGAAPMQLVNAAAAQPLVSGQLAHMPAAAQIDSVAHFASGSSQALTVNHFGGGSTGPAASSSALIANLPKGVRPQDPASTDAVPKSQHDFANCLWWWLQSTPELRSPPAVHDAWLRYVRETVQYCNDYGVHSARAYHICCMEALQHGWWSPLSHGPSYGQAYTMYIAPAAAKGSARPWSRSAAQSASGKYKRKTPPPGDQQSQAPRGAPSFRPCSVHPDSTHTDAQCYQQHGQTRQPARATDAPAAAPSSRPAASGRNR
jgi:hypothetical protein